MRRAGPFTSVLMVAMLMTATAARATVGDFDGDLDVDDADIDLLCANIGGDPLIYDLDGNLIVDSDDHIFLVENLVELQGYGAGMTGTRRGDFDLNGIVNVTDLAAVQGSFGLSGLGWADGNGNCDIYVNATDLALVRANFGFIATGAPVPEPTAMAFLLIGATTVARRKKR